MLGAGLMGSGIATVAAAQGYVVRLKDREAGYLAKAMEYATRVWDKDIAKELRGYKLSIGLPTTDRLVLDRGYAGYQGGLRLIEDMYAAVLAGSQ